MSQQVRDDLLRASHDRDLLRASHDAPAELQSAIAAAEELISTTHSPSET